MFKSVLHDLIPNSLSKSIFLVTTKEDTNNLNETYISNETIKLDCQISLNETVRLVPQIEFYEKLNLVKDG